MSSFEELSVGDVVDGEVTAVVPFGVFVRIADDAHGLLPQATGPEVGTPVQVRLIAIDVERHRAALALA